jgi:integrase
MVDSMSGRPMLPKGITYRRDGRLLAQVYSKRDGRRLSKVFHRRELAAAKAWRRDTQVALAKGALVVGESVTLRKAWEVFLAGMEDGTIRTRSRQLYKPSTIRGYKLSMDRQLLPRMGGLRLNEIRPGQLHRLVGELQAKGLAPNSVRNAMMPLQAIYRWAVRHEMVALDPTATVELPLDRGRRDRFATVQEVELLLSTLAPEDRPLWATAIYAGLRRGELMALRWSDVDLASGVIRVERSHNPESGVTGAPKSEASRRRVPIPNVLREQLLEHRLRAQPTQPLVFARSTLAGRRRTPDGPFNDTAVMQRARKRWEAQGLKPITLHDCRHTYASLLIAAAVPAKAVQTHLGHSSITTTYDRYGHLMPDTESVSAGQLQGFLEAQAAQTTETETAPDMSDVGSPEPSA